MKKPRLSHQGWFCYSDTGRPHRSWTFEEPYEPIGARVGDKLFQDNEGFHVRDSTISVDTKKPVEDYLGRWLIRGHGDHVSFEDVDRGI